MCDPHKQVKIEHCWILSEDICSAQLLLPEIDRIFRGIYIFFHVPKVLKIWMIEVASRRQILPSPRCRIQDGLSSRCHNVRRVVRKCTAGDFGDTGVCSSEGTGFLVSEWLLIFGAQYEPSLQRIIFNESPRETDKCHALTYQTPLGAHDLPCRTQISQATSGTQSLCGTMNSLSRNN
jgi:hypothetical protein